jgi:Protein kinase domain
VTQAIAPATAGTAGKPFGTEAPTGRYRVLAPLAEGGMGSVLSVVDRASGRTLAIKRIKATERDRPQLRAAFEREYRVLSSLKHPRIIEVYDYGVDEDGPYYTMQLLSGEDLRTLAPLHWGRACAIARDLATSLALLHARRLVYRDLNPSNVRLTEGGRAMLLDFGALAGFGYVDTIIGAPPVIPPEALLGGILDARIDLYALGALLYYCLTGRHAYPAKRIDDLPAAWITPPPLPSQLVENVPKDLDTLVAELLSDNPQARPSSAAEVYARLSAIAGLPHEQGDETLLLAQSFLTNPRLVGRRELLVSVDESIVRLVSGRGVALRIESTAGCGRTRMLEEIGLRAQLKGASVLRVDAGADGSLAGVARSLAFSLVTALPVLARAHAKSAGPALEALGADVYAKLCDEGTPTRHPVLEQVEVSNAVKRWLLSVSAARPIVLAVDNLENADDGSLGLLAELAREAPTHALLLVMTERAMPSDTRRIGHNALASHTKRLVLDNLNELAVRELSRTLFGDAPNLSRFSDWLFAATAGNPLHCLEVVKQLLNRGNIRFAGGAFTLPDHRPDVITAGALQDALLTRMEGLDEDALSFAQCVALQRGVASHALCSALCGDEAQARVLLEVLVQCEVLLHDGEGEGVRFTTTALREALLARMDGYRRRMNHRRLGAALELLASPDDYVLRIQAGHHLLRGGEETRGAHILACIMANSATTRTLAANLHQLAAIAEEALVVYERGRRTLYERLPFLCVLSASGYYEDPRWGLRYGDRALDALEQISGLGMARRLSRLLGKRLALFVGLLLGVLRFHLVPRKERVYSFREVLVQLLAAASNAIAIAVMTLDGPRADRITEFLEPFSVLPERLTPAGIYHFANALRFVTREEQVKAQAAYTELTRRFSDPHYYPTLPQNARPLYINGCRYATASFAVFRNDGGTALELATELDRSDLRMYRMIASQMRYLYHAYRGELIDAAIHREQVEVHAAHVGSAAQVEMWEPAALLPLYSMLDDAVGLTRLMHRLESLRTSLPSLGVYAELAAAIVALVRDSDPHGSIARFNAALENRAPRSIIGWAIARGVLARAYNTLGAHEKAAQVCEEVFAHMVPDDADYVTIFLHAELQMVEAELGLGRVADARGRLERLLQRHALSKHPLALGLIWAGFAKLGLQTGHTALYEESLTEMERWFLPTGTPALISQCERLRGKGAPRVVRPTAGDSGYRDVRTETMLEEATATQTLATARATSNTPSLEGT